LSDRTFRWQQADKFFSRARQAVSSFSLKSTVPEISACIAAPPSDSLSVSWPMAAFTSDGPASRVRCLGHENLVAEHRQIGARRDAVAMIAANCGRTGGGEHGVVAEDAAEVVFVRKNFVLHRQKHAGRIDEIDERSAHSNAMRWARRIFLHVIGTNAPGLHRRVVRDQHHGATRDTPIP